MTNEKFQKLVLDYLTKLTQGNIEIKSKLSTTNQKLDRLDKIEADVEVIKNQFRKIS